MANALSLGRGLLAVPFFIWMGSARVEAAGWAALALVLAIASDLLDGPIARRRGTASPLGGSLDHAADFGFVMAGLVAGCSRGVFPWVLPLAVAVAFAQYVIDSYWLHRAGQLRMSSLGRWNGILYFAPLVGDVATRLGLAFLEPLVSPVAWLLVGSTSLSIADRLLALRRPALGGSSPRSDA